jgi:hypothetical protein
VLFVVLAIAGTPRPARSLPACLRGCDSSANPPVDCCADNPCLFDLCSDFVGRRDAARAEYEDCISSSQPECQPGSPGRCTIILKGCIRPCLAQYNAKLTQARNSVFGAGCPDEVACPLDHAKRKAAQACNSCTGLSTTTTSTSSSSTTSGKVTTTIGATTTLASAIEAPATALAADASSDTSGQEIDKCEGACLYRIGALRSCYDDCKSNCKGNSDAGSICKQSCRNFLCEAIRARCTTGVDGANPKTDPEYAGCCTNNDSCLARDEAPCVTTTTSTSSSTSSIVTTTVVSNTTTSTSASFP